MENVVAFNNELSSLYESKPPISKAKMAAITRAAMKAIKFYKHVVQSVEKFILKCKPEYKVPGLYVIDSIVRQSRHQFGAEKDVFAPRFARNMRQTFANLFHCAPDDKSRIIRVLNLWQKNNVFAPEVIQPLFDLADPNHPIYQQTGDNAQDNNNMSSISNGLNLSGQDTSNLTDESHFHSQQSDMMMGHQTGNSLDQNTIRQLQQLQQILIRQTNNDDNSSTTTGGIVTSQSDSIKFNKKVLDYDYGEDEEDEKTNSPHTITNILDSKNLTQLLQDPNVLRQLQTLQKFKEQEEKQSRMKDINKSQDMSSYDKHMQGVFKGPGGNIMNETLINVPDKSPNIIAADPPVIEVINLEDGNDSRSTSPDRDRYKRSRRSSRSKSRDRGGRSDRDRDRDRDRSRRSGRSRSRSRSSRSPLPSSSSSRSNRRRSSREKDRNNKEKEKEKEYERERRRKGLPDIKKEHLTVCSNTLWVGHLSKLVHQEELSDTFGKYGDIISIDMIYPRGCAFIVMNRRQDAFKAMQNLKNHKLQGRVITISWAAGKGVKSKEWKDYWDLDLGVSYIPWLKLNENTDLEALEEGGMFDEDTMPNWMKDRMNSKKSDNREQNNQNILGTEGVQVDTSQPPPTAGAMIPGVSLIPPYSAMGPVPRLMPPPLGVPMTGSMVPGLPMPANIVPGIPPPHMMMPPPTGMVSGFAPMPTPLDKPITSSGVPSSEPQTTSVPPSYLGANVGGIHLAPHIAQQQQPPFGGPGIPHQFPPSLTDQSNTVSSNVNQGEDHMDIEMEDENPSIPNKLLGNSSGPSVQFSQPPPLFPTFSSELLSMSNRNSNQTNDRDLRNANDNDDRNDIEFERLNNRNRDGNREKSVEFGKRDREQNRWSSERSLSGGDRDAQTRIRDRNNMDREKSNNARGDFNRTGSSQQEQQGRSIPPIWQNSAQNFPVPLFNDNQQRRNPMDMNISALDVNNPQFQRLHFDMQRNNEFIGDDRRGGGGMISQQQPQRDFFQNINNLSNIPSLVNNLGNRFGPAPAMNRGGGSNMSIRPPFTPRLGPMFMRGPIRPGPPGFNFNDRPAFERDENRGGGGGGRTRNNDNRRSGGRSNWRDDDNNRRSNVSGSGGNRFRDRDNDRQNRDKNDNDGGRGRRDRSKDGGNRTDRDKNHNRGGRGDRDRSNERDGRRTDGRKSDTESTSQNDTNDNKSYRNNSPIRPSEDTEEDWDKELSDHNVDHNSNREEMNTQNNNNENLESWDSGDDENQFDNNNPNSNQNFSNLNNDDNEQLDDYDGNGYDDDNDHFNRENNRNRNRNLNNTVVNDDMQEYLNSSTEESSSLINKDNTKMNNNNDNSNVTDENENENEKQQDIPAAESSSSSFNNNDNNSNNNQEIENSS